MEKTIHLFPICHIFSNPFHINLNTHETKYIPLASIPLQKYTARPKTNHNPTTKHTFQDTCTIQPYFPLLLQRNSFTSFVHLCLVIANWVSLQDSHHLYWLLTLKKTSKTQTGFDPNFQDCRPVVPSLYATVSVDFSPLSDTLWCRQDTAVESDTSLEWPLSPSNPC